MAAKALTVKEILEMTSDELKVIITDLGEDPKGMTKTVMQDYLVHHILKPDNPPDVSDTSPVEVNVEGEIPSFVSSLSAELKL